MSDLERALGRIASARADGYGIVVRRQSDPDPVWTGAGSLGNDPDLTARTVAAVSGMYGPPEPFIQAEWLLESLARAIADLAGSFALAVDALPPLEPDNLLFALEGGLVRGVAVRSDRLEGGSPEQLADRIRDGLDRLLSPTVAWIAGEKLRPAKTLWHAAADRVVQGFDWCGKAFDRPDASLELARLTVGPDSPDPKLAIRLERAEDEYGEEFHRRNTCCLAYRTEGGELCLSCPLQETGRGEQGPPPANGSTLAL